jgi:subtilisin family serine protease
VRITGLSDHGTFTAGLTGAEFNGLGARGVANNVELMALAAITGEFYTVAELEGLTRGGELDDINVTKAIDYARENQVKIINASFGEHHEAAGLTCKNFLDTAQYQAIKNFPGLFIAAAGNEEDDLSSGNYHLPSSYAFTAPGCWDALPNIIAVGASSKAGTRWQYSNYGHVDIYAPGVDIYSTSVNNGYSTGSGTSASAPIVSGIAALLWGIDPNLTTTEVKDIIVRTSKKSDPYDIGIFPMTARDGHQGRIASAFKAVYEVIKQQKETKSCPINSGGGGT